MSKYTLTEYCNINGGTELLSEWDYEKNGNLTPDDVSYGSRKRVWWKCKNGHSWQTYVQIRANGSKCPYCSGRLVVKGETDLATIYPDLAKEWHPTKNEFLKPSDVRPGAERKVWWKCEKGHEWQAPVKSRTHGKGCPICADKKIVAGINDFASQYPELAKQWHPTKNGALKPDMITAWSGRAVWWQDEFGHEWRTTIAFRTYGSGCPFCTNKKLLSGFNDLQTRFPELAREWDSKKNGITPDKVMATTQKVWWICPEGHEYQSKINARAYLNNGCPICAGEKVAAGVNDLATLYPNLAKEWHPTKNGELTPDSVACGTGKKVWWQDSLGHEWTAQIKSRTISGSGCPYCAGKKVLIGFNDLASQAPKLAAEWHPTMNGTKTPEMFTCGSSQNVWWQCGEGHIWQAPIGRRYCAHAGCPVCAETISKKRLERYDRMMLDYYFKNPPMRKRKNDG